MKIKEVNRVPRHMTTIGGQALIEGILMRGPRDIAIAIRKPDDEIVLTKSRLNTLGTRYRFFALPIIRGVVGLIESMAFGMKALMYSAEHFEEGMEEPQKETLFRKVFKDRSEDVEMALTLLLALAMTIAFFILLPSFLTNLLRDRIGTPFILNIVEGLIRITIFFIYIVLVSKMEEIGRVFEYHGAEHKTIHCYENGEELTIDNVRKHPILHPRCGTSFLFMVMIVSILVLSFFGWPNPMQRLLIRLVMLPVIAGISYEINRLIGKSNSQLSYILSYPGLLIQKMATVKEPDDGQIEVAIEALNGVLTGDGSDDLWR
ncbi:MAG: DUF1385 domain-containing protein [Tissierellia bacterium]|nr:DUF1385 domain-containing protein [Tissierellia bacterium]